jgi:hypothetical protein
MLNTYLAEQQAQQHAAAVERALAHQQRVHLALAHQQRSSPTMNGRYARVIRWLRRHTAVWGNHLDSVQAEDRV